MDNLRWGILGASKFALQSMAPAIHAARGADFAALATSDPVRAEPFAAFRPGLKVHRSYEALLADPDIDSVYIPLPNTMHKEWTLRALDAGKHVLCEKPLGLAAGDFDAVIAKRDATGLLAAEAFMIVHHPQFIRARELVGGGAIGALRHVDAVFAYNLPGAADNIRNRPETGGGGLPDIGVYTIGATRFVSGQEPEKITYADLTYENGVDVVARFAARFDGFSLMSMVSMRMMNRQEVVFHGEAGVLRLTCPFNANVFDQAELHLETPGGKVTIERFAGVNQYILQVENFGRAVRGEIAYPCPLEFSRGTQAMIDMIYSASAQEA